ncbi:MAG: hypothetical protein H6810_04845 [Phycisphaeraceae bacterium]|nr:MAG: hypothetical protein H6810_04845 [Phycisphaeraceae bacterium]
MIPLFVGYALVVWVAAARHRRRVGGFLAVLMGLAGLVGLNYLHGLLSDWSGGTIFLPVLRSIMYPYTALVVVIGFYIACLPRTSLVGCAHCGYSLHGLSPRYGIFFCPECGGGTPVQQAYRRSGADRPDLRGTDRRLSAHHAVGAARNQDQQRQPTDEPPSDRAQRPG